MDFHLQIKGEKDLVSSITGLDNKLKIHGAWIEIKHSNSPEDCFYVPIKIPDISIPTSLFRCT